MKNFVIAGQQRTGTTMLVRTLDRYESIRCLGELFIRTYPNRTLGSYQEYIRQSVQRRCGDVLQKARTVERYLDDVLAAPRFVFASDEKSRRCEAIGFKLMYGQSRKSPAVLRYLQDRRLPVIHVVRNNVLHVLASREVNRVFDIPHATKPVTAPQVTIGISGLLSLLSRIEEINRNWERLLASGPYLKITYEDLVAHWQREMRRILDFLGFHDSPVHEPPTVKLNSSELRHVIANYDEVAGALKGTVFETCLNR